MKCNNCGAPATPGVTICEYCGQPLEFGASVPPAGGAPAAGPSPGMAPPGASPAPGGGGAKGSGIVRALAPDGCWYPVAASQIPGGKVLVRFNDGRQATVSAEEVRHPADPGRLNSGVRVLGECEGRYFPGTVMQATADGWAVQFDDGENATLPADVLSVFDAPQPPIPPGTQVLAQSREDGCWYPGRIMSGPDQNGRQKVRIDAGGVEECTRAQLNGPAGEDLCQPDKRVMGIGPDGLWYPGTVQQATQGQVYIKFDDNEEAWVMAHEVRFIC